MSSGILIASSPEVARAMEGDFRFSKHSFYHLTMSTQQCVYVFKPFTDIMADYVWESIGVNMGILSVREAPKTI